MQQKLKIIPKALSVIDSRKHIKSGVTPLQDSSDNIVTDGQSNPSMLNNSFNSVINTTSDIVTPNDANNIDESSRAPLVNSEHTLQGSETTTKDVLDIFTCMKTI